MSAGRLTFRYRHQGTQYQFSIEAPFQAGHECTRAEAQALNQLRLENIRENMRPSFAAVAESADQSELLPESLLAEIQAKIDEYDSTYQFKELAETPEKLSSVEREARILARARLPEEASEEEIAALAASIDLVAEATLRLEARKKVTSVAMEELLK